jgi:hypothetical protein
MHCQKEKGEEKGRGGEEKEERTLTVDFTHFTNSSKQAGIVQDNDINVFHSKTNRNHFLHVGHFLLGWDLEVTHRTLRFSGSILPKKKQQRQQCYE